MHIPKYYFSAMKQGNPDSTECSIQSDFSIQIKAIITSIQTMNKIPYENI